MPIIVNNLQQNQRGELKYLGMKRFSEASQSISCQEHYHQPLAHGTGAELQLLPLIVPTERNEATIEERKKEQVKKI